MNSRKKRFWKLWQKRNEETAVTNVKEANRIRYIKFSGKELPEYIQCFDYKAKVMKTNELMIGDWVTGKKWRENPFKLSRINDNGKYYYGITSDGTQVGLFLLEEIEPISLTPEILEKNGFRLVFDGELHKTYFQDIERFHTEIRIDKVGIYQKLYMCDGLGNGIEIVECKNVHQFQHALRLCGINHEIIL